MLTHHRYIITAIFLSLFIGACHQKPQSDYADESNPETTRQKDDNTGKKEDLYVDSSNIVVFDMYHNQTKWGKNDTTVAKISSKEGFWFLTLKSTYKSLLREDISFTGMLGTHDNTPLELLLREQGDTLKALVYYSYAEDDFNTGSHIPKKYIGMSIKPTAQIFISKVDTQKNTISGRFKGYVTDNVKRKHSFENGIFRNIPLVIME